MFRVFQRQESQPSVGILRRFTASRITIWSAFRVAGLTRTCTLHGTRARNGSYADLNATTSGQLLIEGFRFRRGT